MEQDVTTCDPFDPLTERIKVQSVWFQALQNFGNWRDCVGDNSDRISHFGKLFEEIFEKGHYEFQILRDSSVKRAFDTYVNLPVNYKEYYKHLRKQLAQYLVNIRVLPDVNEFYDGSLDRMLLISVFGDVREFESFYAVDLPDNDVSSSVRHCLGREDVQ